MFLLPRWESNPPSRWKYLEYLRIRNYFSGTGYSQDISSSAMNVTACKSGKSGEGEAQHSLRRPCIDDINDSSNARWFIYLFIFRSHSRVYSRVSTGHSTCLNPSLNMLCDQCQTKYRDTQSRGLEAGKVGRQSCALKKLQHEKKLYQPLYVYFKPLASTFKLDLDCLGRNQNSSPTNSRKMVFESETLPINHFEKFGSYFRMK